MREEPQRDIVSSDQSRPRNRQYLPLDKRMKLYRLVTELVGDGLSYRHIQKVIFYEERLWLSKGAISEWAREVHSPSGRINPFRPDPCPELDYVIGVVLSDGNLNIHGYNAEILLSVTDYDFAEEFSRCLAKILSKGNRYRVRRSEKRNRWIVQGSSVLLHRFLNRPLQRLKPWIEHCKECTAAFLRAFYDGEGSMSGRQLVLYNTQADILLYIQGLLCKLGIESTDLNRQKRAGTELISPLNGRIYVRNRDCFDFHIRAKSLLQFEREIGFTITRKQQRLVNAVSKRLGPPVLSGTNSLID